MELADLRIFARIADLSSISAAARNLTLPKSSVSRSLARLEEEIGALLVDRSTRHLRLTDAGILFRPHALRILADVEEAGTALDGFAGTPRGTLRVSAPVSFAVALVAPMLPSFLARYPAVRVVLDVENRFVAMPVEAVDLGIRVGALPDSDLIARHLMTSEAWTCASPSYLADHGTPASVADLDGHCLIGLSDRRAAWSYRSPAGTTEEVASRAATVISEPLALAPVLVAGAGIGRLPDFIAAPLVANGALVRILSGLRGDAFDIHAVYPSHRSLSAKVRAFIDCLAGALDNGKANHIGIAPRGPSTCASRFLPEPVRAL